MVCVFVMWKTSCPVTLIILKRLFCGSPCFRDNLNFPLIFHSAVLPQPIVIILNIFLPIKGFNLAPQPFLVVLNKVAQFIHPILVENIQGSLVLCSVQEMIASTALWHQVHTDVLERMVSSLDKMPTLQFGDRHWQMARAGSTIVGHTILRTVVSHHLKQCIQSLFHNCNRELFIHNPSIAYWFEKTQSENQVFSLRDFPND